MTAKIIPMYERHLKVAYKWQATNNNPQLKEERRVPFISLAGYWLQEAGFVIGDKVTIAVEPNRLTIIRTDVDRGICK